MKKRITQFEFPIPEEPFALVSESTGDGERLQRDGRTEAADRRESEARNAQLNFSQDERKT